MYPYGHFQELLDGHRWQQIVDQFREENYKLYQLNNTPVLTVSLEAGLAAMKAPYPLLQVYLIRPFLDYIFFFSPEVGRVMGGKK